MVLRGSPDRPIPATRRESVSYSAKSQFAEDLLQRGP